MEFLIPLGETISGILTSRFQIPGILNSRSGNLFFWSLARTGFLSTLVNPWKPPLERQTASVKRRCCKMATGSPFPHVREFREFLIPVADAIFESYPWWGIPGITVSKVQRRHHQRGHALWCCGGLAMISVPPEAPRARQRPSQRHCSGTAAAVSARQQQAAIRQEQVPAGCRPTACRCLPASSGPVHVWGPYV